MSSIQHAEARKLLPIIFSAAAAAKPLTYGTAAQALGRPKTNSRAVAQVCDLLDAAAAFAGVPLLALVTVLDQSHHINPNAWKGDSRREKIIARSKR
jgi:hypothetical protein